MAELIAQGFSPTDCWRLTLAENDSFTLGRTSGPRPVTWDRHISREHAELAFREGQLEVRKSATARNPIFHRGAEQETFHLQPGDFFVIGQTRFLLSSEAEHSDDVVARHTFAAAELDRVPLHTAAGPQRLDLLNQLPEIIARAVSDRDLFRDLANLLLVGIPRAEAVAFVGLANDGPEDGHVQVMHLDLRRDATSQFLANRSLVAEAVRKEKTSVSRIWVRGGDTSSRGPTSFQWAFCTPVRGEACTGWGIYVTGTFPVSPDQQTLVNMQEGILRYDVKFTELVAALLSSLRQVKQLQERQASLRQFFSRGMLERLPTRDIDQELRPRPARIVVLFCDLRGFSGLVEEGDLLVALEGVSTALGVMTEHIAKENGVIGDFHGDAVMGFWGWPGHQPDAVMCACRAALGIRATFHKASEQRDSRLAGFKVGIGIATGEGVAGAIGTLEQVKVTAFGPVVNLASRLEGMTKILKAPILMDETTAEALRGNPACRQRRLVRLIPYRLKTPLFVYELLPPASDDSTLTDENIRRYEEALDDFLAGRWPEAAEKLHQIPAEDRAKYFLMRQVLGEEPPPDWNDKQAIVLDRKA